MANGSSIYGVLFVAAVGWIYQVVRGGQKIQSKTMEITGENPLAGFKALIKTGKTDALATDEAIDPRFQAHYDQYIRPKIEAFEAKRVEALSVLRKRMMIVIPLALVVLILGLTLTKSGSKESSPATIAGYEVHVTSTSSGNPVGAIGSMLVGVLAIWAFWPVWQYKSSIKQSIFPDVFRFYGSQWRYDPNGIGGYNLSNLVRGNALDAYKELKSMGQKQPPGLRFGNKKTAFMEPYMAYGILPRHDSASTKNFLSGDYKAVPITLVQCTLSSSNGSDGGDSGD